MSSQETENGVSPRFSMTLNEYFSDVELTEKIELEMKKGFFRVPLRTLFEVSEDKFLKSLEPEL